MADYHANIVIVQCILLVQKEVIGTVSKKKKLMEFSIKLAGWVLDAPVFHKKKEK